MIAKCKNCRFVRITRMRKTCPHCGATLTRPTVAELQSIGDEAMYKARFARCYLESNNKMHDRPLILAGFMDAIHGQRITRHQAEEMLKP